MVLASKWVKRIGITLSVNEKDGCFVMITLDMFSNIELTPLIVIKGVFDFKKTIGSIQEHEKSNCSIYW